MTPCTRGGHLGIRLPRPAHRAEEPSRDYDFSDAAIKANKSEGYAIAKRELSKAGLSQSLAD